MRNSLPSRVTDELFDRIHAILGDKFFDFYKGADPQVFRDEWSAALADFKPVELERGLVQMTRQKFVPTLGEFSQWCRPALDPEWAFHEAHACLMQRDQGKRGDWSHPAVWRAACALSLEVRQQDYAKVRTRWKLTLEREFAAGWGEPIPEPPLKLGHTPDEGTSTSEIAMRERAKIREMLGKRTRTECTPGGFCERSSTGGRPCHAGQCAKKEGGDATQAA